MKRESRLRVLLTGLTLAGLTVILTPKQELIIEPRQSLNLPAGVGLTAGLDARIGGRHFAFIPSFRFRRRLASLGDDFDLDSHYPSGFPGSTISFRVVGRIDF